MMKTHTKKAVEERVRRSLGELRSLNGSLDGADHLISNEKFEEIVRQEVLETIRQIRATGGTVVER